MSDKILIVDDEPLALAVLEKWLLREGFTVQWALNGREALDRMKDNQFELIITDLKMPGIDGIELIKAVKEIDSDIEIIVITGYATANNAIDALRLNRAYDFVIKPIDDFEKFMLTVRKAIERRHLVLEKKSLLEALALSNMKLKRENEERKRFERYLREKQDELETNSRVLNETNIALKVLFNQRETDKLEMEENMLHNVRELVLPQIEHLKNFRLTSKQNAIVELIERNINEIISPFAKKFSPEHFNLTPSEIQTANFIKQGKSTKEIAEILNLSTRTIETHRDNIRKKAGIKNKRINLRSFLLSLEA